MQNVQVGSHKLSQSHRFGYSDFIRLDPKTSKRARSIPVPLPTPCLAYTHSSCSAPHQLILQACNAFTTFFHLCPYITVCHAACAGGQTSFRDTRRRAQHGWHRSERGLSGWHQQRFWWQRAAWCSLIQNQQGASGEKLVVCHLVWVLVTSGYAIACLNRNWFHDHRSGVSCMCVPMCFNAQGTGRHGYMIAFKDQKAQTQHKHMSTILQNA